MKRELILCKSKKDAEVLYALLKDHFYNKTKRIVRISKLEPSVVVYYDEV